MSKPSAGDQITIDAPFDGSSASAPIALGDVFRFGQVLNETYEIGVRLGEGGMGQVFEAHDRLLRRKVAVKVATSGAPPGTLLREAQALAAIRHPSMVTVHALREDRGTQYVVMERIFGTTLDARLARIKSEPMKLPEIIAVLVGIAGGLTAVHNAGVAHRDITPRNIMLASDRVVIMDLGIFVPEAERTTRAKTITGSPSHMGPEAIMNAVAPGEAYLLDIYALGIIAFEMVTGELPFHAESVHDLLSQHRTAPVPEVHPLHADVPPNLARLIREMLSKKPAERPQSAESVAWRLRSIAGSGARASSPSF